MKLATLTIRNLPEKIRDDLRIIAAKHGRSMEAEARELITVAVAQRSKSGAEIFNEIQQRFAKIDGADLESIEQEIIAEPTVQFDHPDYDPA